MSIMIIVINCQSLIHKLQITAIAKQHCTIITFLLVTNECSAGDTVIVETDYPGCILDRDKIRLYKQSSTSMTRPKYVGEQRVIRVRKHLITLCLS